MGSNASLLVHRVQVQRDYEGATWWPESVQFHAI
jgi:hypothetical protein